jgi:formylmethanofuran dehydrogenase subunit E
MNRLALSVWLCGLAVVAVAGEPIGPLPKPHYDRQPSDPDWLVQVTQIHGHLGPSVVAGARMGMAGLRAVAASGYFDIEVTCEGPLAKPPQSCFLDGLQAGSGATLGKRNLQWVQADQITVRIKNTRSGRTAELRPTPELLHLLAWSKPQPAAGSGSAARPKNTADENPEAVARKIASLPEKDIISVRIIDGRGQVDEERR